MTYSRVKKYQELRDGLKEEVGISKEKYVEPVQNDGDDDDFVIYEKDKEEKEVNLEDTLTETKTFEQMREEGSAELDKALKSAKESVGKQDQYNTRMDILSKIREPEKNTIKIDSVESYATQEFAKGMFVNNKVKEEPKEKNDFLWKKLAAMSPEEDVKKAEEFLQQESEEVEEKQAEKITETKEIVETIEENPVEDIEENDTFIEDEEEIIENKGESKVVKVMNVIIVILVIIFIALLGVILYQSFF